MAAAICGLASSTRVEGAAFDGLLEVRAVRVANGGEQDRLPERISRVACRVRTGADQSGRDESSHQLAAVFGPVTQVVGVFLRRTPSLRRAGSRRRRSIRFAVARTFRPIVERGPDRRRAWVSQAGVRSHPIVGNEDFRRRSLYLDERDDEFLVAGQAEHPGDFASAVPFDGGQKRRNSVSACRARAHAAAARIARSGCSIPASTHPKVASDQSQPAWMTRRARWLKGGLAVQERDEESLPVPRAGGAASWPAAQAPKARPAGGERASRRASARSFAEASHERCAAQTFGSGVASLAEAGVHGFSGSLAGIEQSEARESECKVQSGGRSVSQV